MESSNKGTNMFGWNKFPIASVTPFTYRDGLTFLGILEILRREVRAIINAINDLVNHVKAIDDSIETIVSDVNKRITDFEVLQDKKLAMLREELLTAIETTTAGGMAWNPTNGRIESISDVLSDVYDNVRVHARFAYDLDNLNLTVAQIAEKDDSARHFDLSPLDATNDELRIA